VVGHSDAPCLPTVSTVANIMSLRDLIFSQSQPSSDEDAAPSSSSAHVGVQQLDSGVDGSDPNCDVARANVVAAEASMYTGGVPGLAAHADQLPKLYAESSEVRAFMLLIVFSPRSIANLLGSVLWC
jgi:hypothetical protein